MFNPEINTLRKQGCLEQALSIAEADYSRSPGKQEAISLFWCLNDVVKLAPEDQSAPTALRMQELAQKHDPENEILAKAVKHALQLTSPQGRAEKEGWNILNELKQTDLGRADIRSGLLARYLQLPLERPSRLHSRIMAEATKMDKRQNGDLRFAEFADAWGLENLTPDDWKQTEAKNGFKIPSLTEKIITAYIKDVHHANARPSEAFRRVLDEAAAAFPENQHLQRYQAQIMVKDGKVEEAIERYKKLLMKSPDRFYLWDDVAELISDPELKISLLCASITSGAYDEFLVNIRLKLAELLCSKGMLAEAQAELENYKRTHQNNNWPLKRKFYNVANQVPQSTIAADNRQLYAAYQTRAHDFVYSAVPMVYLIKVWEKKDAFKGKTNLSWKMRGQTETYWIQPRNFRLDFSTRNGAAFQAKIADGHIAWIAPVEFPSDLPWLKTVSGPLHIKNQADGKIYGFVENVFVPTHLLHSMTEGRISTVKAIDNGSDRWSAITLE